MRPILNFGLFTLLLLSASCATDEFDQCLESVSFRDHETPTLPKAIAAEERPSSYVATKGVSMMGFYYLVVANYEDRSIATMYRTGLGVRSVDLSADRGRSLYESATHTISETRSSHNKGVFDGEHCHFVRAGSGQERIDGKYVNPSRDESGEGIERMFYEFDSLLDAGYGEITFDSYADKDIPLPPDYSEDELAALTKKNRRNIFRELDDLWLHPKN